MKQPLIFKLLAIHLVVISFVMAVVWVSIDMLAAGYFVTLMEKYHISPEPAHDMFVEAVHRYLIWSCLGAVMLAVFLSYVLMRRALVPLKRMGRITAEIAAGNFSERVPENTRDEVGRLGGAFNRMAQNLEKIETLRRNLMIDVAHELRTPLTNIRGYLEALTDGVIAPSKEIFSLLQDETLRLAQLVEDVLELARADAARGRLEIRQVTLERMIKESLEPFSRMLTEKSIKLHLNGIETGVTAPADPRRLARVLRNLADNAARYTPDGGEILISVEPVGSAIRVDYINTIGPGRVPDNLSHMFERFYRGEQSRSRDHGGAGIGLAIVKELVEAHGGNVGAELIDSDRIRIWFTLPSLL